MSTNVTDSNGLLKVDLIHILMNVYNHSMNLKARSTVKLKVALIHLGKANQVTSGRRRQGQVIPQKDVIAQHLKP